ncbi:Superfamily I DNA and RNA helicase-like protein [Kribbella flavida DSM 17836]|uniref:Superfamily I DNA and RNA helicase-like protein n=1 Tax=Kribbella flavida (strain DSM 17836 / JCM 10339 / NBRC 14399) TaxID=479435 RepID=D2Q0D3_KRIFD|nr:UvrD-helicase domain-containing protein [Kribbella flavida]ADB31925.1 Superfamily I DNA and RNA helicase-like protein [Kribbella flavida DSM 17836]
MDQTPTSPDPETVERAELEAEQQHVDRVYDRVAEAARSASRIAVEGHQRAQAQNVGRVREEEQTGLYERDVLVFAAARRIAELDAEHEGLVFGRLDSDGGDDRPAAERAGDLDKLYVGRIGVRDAEYEPLVIDWRAPAAEPFYRATSTDRLGVVRRRVLRNKGARIIGIEDDLLAPERAPEDLPVMGEGALMASLSRARGHTMRDIVATIQAEQDKAIRAPARGVTVIGGGPGTGKTVVALHRAAYLLYSDRRRFERGGVLVVGPSAAFMAYIERVLPSLGENTVSLRAVGELVDGVRATAIDEADVAAIKGSLRMRGVLSRAARDRVPGAPTSLRVFVGGATVELDANQLDNVRRNALRRTPRNRAAAEARKGLVAALWSRFPEDLRNGVYGDRESFGDAVTDLPAYRSFFAAWWPVLTAQAVLRWLGDPRRLTRWARHDLTTAEIETLAAGIAGTDELTVADVALLDELTTLLGRPPVVEAGKDEEFDWLEGLSDGVNEVLTTSERRARAAAAADADEPEEYAHVLVDEAQDLSPMQWRMVTRRGPQASWTIVGDPAQSSWPDPDEARTAMETMLSHLQRHTFRLSTNYRNSAEIYAFAGEVIRQQIPDADLPDAVRRTGVKPELRVFDAGKVAEAAGDAAGELLELVEGTVGVIVPPKLRPGVDAVLAELDNPRIAALTPLESKGLEYDAVVVVEPDRIVSDTLGGVRALYVVLTRATQRMITINSSTHWLPPHGSDGGP